MSALRRWQSERERNLHGALNALDGNLRMSERHKLLKRYAHELAEKIRNRDYDPGEVQPVHITVQDDADLIDPEVK